MKYAIGYKAKESGPNRWQFMTFGPTKQFPFGYWFKGIRIFDTLQEATDTLHEVTSRPEYTNKPDTTEQIAWKEKIQVIVMPKGYLDKRQEANDLLNHLLANPREGVPEGSRENALFHRGHEVHQMQKAATGILDVFLLEEYG